MAIPAPATLLRATDGRDFRDLATYEAHGGYAAFRQALLRPPADVIAEVKTATLRGRGGAGFPTGMKWSFVPQNTGKPVYLVVNADEGEPGTFKDRYFLEHDPHRLIEGALICAYAVGAQTAYIYIRGEFAAGAAVLATAIEEARAGRILTAPLETARAGPYSLEIHVHRGAGAYICGEETALLDSLEGKAGLPRLKPPFPAVAGLFGCPTVVNNVETLASLPGIFALGGAAWRDLGERGDGGVKLVGVSGDVVRPGLYEIAMGQRTLHDLIFTDCGGIRDRRALKLVLPGGSSTVCLLPHELDVPLSFGGLAKVASAFGTAGVIVVAEPTCAVALALRLARFYAHESCGQCTPCREGTGWLARILGRIEDGLGAEGDVDLILDVCNHIEGNTICALGDACAIPVRALARKFRDEFEAHIRDGGCPLRRS